MASTRHRAILVLALIFGLLPLTGQSAAPPGDAEPWKERYVNPKPLADDLVLPMPCGASMTFRPVEVPSEGWLGDRKLILGGSDERFDHVENNRYAYLSGSFTDPDNPARRSYFLGKYEVTKDQFAALNQPCPKPNMKGRLPAVGLSWFDAVSFAHDYSSWLRTEAPAALPSEDGEVGFVRLPTEAEWEYAARGGILVSDVEFLAPVFPTPEGLHKYMWFGGSRSANGRLQLTGLLKPNPLGLHDMLGNADELVLEPFRLNKLARFHGQVGGHIIKGGNYLTSTGDIRSAYRQELAPYDARGAKTLKTVGFRLVIADVVLTSRQRVKSVRKEWRALPSTVAVVGSGKEQLDDPIKELELVKQATTDGDLRVRLDALALVVKANIASRNAQRGRAGKGVIRLGAFLGAKISDDLRRVRAIGAIVKGREEAGSSPALLKKVRAGLAASENTLSDNLQYYADTVVQLVQDYPSSVIDRQLEALLVEFESRDLKTLIPHAQRFVRHTTAYRDSLKIDVDDLRGDFSRFE